MTGSQNDWRNLASARKGEATPSVRVLGSRTRHASFAAELQLETQERLLDPRTRVFRKLGEGPTELVIVDAVEDDELEDELASAPARAFVIALWDRIEAGLRDDLRVNYVARPDIGSDSLACLAAKGWPREQLRGAGLESVDPARVQAGLELVRRLAMAKGQTAASSLLEAGLCELLDADRVRCLFHDGDSARLWTLAPIEREQPTSAGLTGYVAHTGVTLAVPRAGEDPRSCQTFDDPGGHGRNRLLLAPILGPSLAVEAVLVAVRGGERPVFDGSERRLLELVCARAGAMLTHVREVEHTGVRVREQERSQRGMTRVEALREQAEVNDHGSVVQTMPRWTKTWYWLVLLMVFAGSMYLVFGRVSLYSAGPAVVHLHERAEVVAPASGALVELSVEAGSRVETGDLLARLDDTRERGELERLQHSFDQRLRARLLDPQDDKTITPLTQLRRQLDDAHAALDERAIRAPWAGTVSDLRMRPGQHIGTGQVLMSVLRDVEDRRVLALMPGADSPRIEPGMTLRMELPNYNRAYQHLVVERVAQEVVGPSEAKRFLGPASADSVALNGPVVLVEARLPSPEFEVDGVRYRYHEGMQARAEVRVRSESLLELLIPGLRGVVPNG